MYSGSAHPGGARSRFLCRAGFRGGWATGERPGGGGLGGKVMNGAGILGDLAFIWEGWKTLERGCDNVVISCGPRRPPDRRGLPRWTAHHTTQGDTWVNSASPSACHPSATTG